MPRARAAADWFQELEALLVLAHGLMVTRENGRPWM